VTDSEMIVIRLEGKTAMMWRSLLEHLDVENDKELYEKLVSGIFGEGMMMLNQRLIGELGDDEREEVANMLEKVVHARVKFHPELKIVADNSMYVTVMPDSIMIAYVNKQEVVGGSIFFLPDGLALTIPKEAILDVDMKIDLVGRFK